MNILKNKVVYLSVPVASLLPFIANAQLTGSSRLSDVVNLVAYYFQLALGLLMGLAVVLFVWYVIKYFMKPGTDRAEAGQYVMYSVIGFFVILSFWGLVRILLNTFGVSNRNTGPDTWSQFQSDIFPGSSSRGGSGGAMFDVINVKTGNK